MVYKAVKMDFTDEELDFFSELFSHHATPNDNHHHLTIKQQVPDILKQILGQSKLTLLAEVSHYQLWFPFELKLMDGDFKPILGIPEIVDLEGGERSWRLNNMDNIKLHDDLGNEYNLVSLSSTGLSFQCHDINGLHKIGSQQHMHIALPDDQQIELAFEPVRTENNIIAARIAKVTQGRDRLRQFLFNLHRDKHKNLYQT